METKRILILDDNYESMKPLKIHLEAVSGFEVELTANSAILERLKREEFDLLIIDLMIHPTGLGANGEDIANVSFSGVHWQTTGYEFLKRLRNGDFCATDGRGTKQDVPVILLSAVADMQINNNTNLNALVHKCFEKPFATGVLVSEVEQLLNM